MPEQIDLEAQLAEELEKETFVPEPEDTYIPKDWRPPSNRVEPSERLSRQRAAHQQAITEYDGEIEEREQRITELEREIAVIKTERAAAEAYLTTSAETELERLEGQ